MNQLRIVAVTACVSGVAYTYMAAEKLNQLAKLHNYKIKIETRGALGITDQLTEEDIVNADIAIVISEMEIEDIHKFNQSRLILIAINKFLQDKINVNSIVNKIRRLSKPTRIEY